MKSSFALVVSALLLCAACRQSGLPEPGSKQYADLCSAFYLGLAGLQSGEDVRAKEYLTRSTVIAPGEPAPWLDLGVLQVRQQQFDAAYGTVDKARSLSPSESRIEGLLGLIESRRGNLPQAVAHLQKAVSLDGHNLKAIYSLAQESEREANPDAEARAQQQLRSILAQQPANAAVLLDDLRLAAKRGDGAEARRALDSLKPLSGAWPDAARRQFATVEQVVASGNVRPAAVQVQFLRNILLRVPAYRENLDQIATPATLVAQPFTHFLRLPSPGSEPAAPDTAMRLDRRPVAGIIGAHLSWIGAFSLANEDPTVAWVDDSALHLASGAVLPLPGTQQTLLQKAAVAAVDLNYDFKADIAIANSSGLKLYRQHDPGHFHDITVETKIPAGVAKGEYTGVWPFDVDLDGDLDLILGVSHGEPVVLRNNGDGTLTSIGPFKRIDGLTALASADIDGDGDPDLAFIDSHGTLRIFLNERLGSFRARDVPSNASTGVRDVAAADINGDGIVDFVLLKNDGSVVRLSQKQDSTDWEYAEMFRAPSASAQHIVLADVDNNGALDVLVDGQVFLNDGKNLGALPAPVPLSLASAADLNRDGKLDLVGLDGNGAAIEAINRGSKNYQWQVIRTKAAQATGDQRINSFGIGGEIELRSDLLAQKQIITAPVLHFGLGDHTAVQFARIVWPNGFVQAEFDLKSDQALLAEQRIKGSCPMLFTWNGQNMEFLKDVGPWGSALGLNVNAQGKGIYGTREWFNIRGDQLVPRNGFYDLRITAEYWETYYMDHYSLLAVDHPAGTEVYTDERFALPSPTPGYIVTGQSKPFSLAVDDNGTDVTAIVADLDNRFLDNFGRGQYQGLTRKHWVELELPADAPEDCPLYLIGQGWIHDTDATIVKAQAQNSKAHPEGLSIEVPDASGHWKTVRTGLGFPKGRVKTITLDLTGIFSPGAPRKFRLCTNLELYWNKLAWAPGFPDKTHVVTHPVHLASADLRFRGFSLITRADPSSPELPHYDLVQESDLRWRDQEGYATRYGDVRELLDNIDDRYVITSPGDELRMKFPALPAPANGFRRDFILICDGWVKDGDYNSTFAGTILPLPYHAMTDYVLAPTTLEADHAYQLHPDDWRKYQTRYVTPRYFDSALWSRRP